jgi:hypothetical protein
MTDRDFWGKSRIPYCGLGVSWSICCGCSIWDGFPSSDEAGEIGREGKVFFFVGELGRTEKRAADPEAVGKDELLLASLMGEGDWVFDLTGEEEGLGRARERSPRAPIVGGMRGGLPIGPSWGDGGKGRPLVKLLLRSRCCWPASADVMELEEPEGPGLNASCELEALAARSEEGSGRVRFQYGTNLVEEGDGSEGGDG